MYVHVHVAYTLYLVETIYKYVHAGVNKALECVCVCVCMCVWCCFDC